MQEQLLREAAEWRLLGLLLECPTGGAWHAQVRGLAGEVGDANLREAAESAQQEANEGDYHSIFGPGGPAPPREVSYQDSVQLGYLLSELEGYYQAFGYAPSVPESPDHVAVEAGFVGYLRLKEAYALASGDAEHAAVTADAARRFIDDHLANVAEPLAKSLGNSGFRYLALAGEALLDRVGPRKGAPAAQPFRVLPTGETEREECLFECGES